MKDTFYKDMAPLSVYDLMEKNMSTSDLQEALKGYEHSYEDGANSMLSLVLDIEDYLNQEPKKKLQVLKKLTEGFIPIKIGKYTCDEILNEEILDLDYSEYSEDMELFFKKVIASVYLDGVEEIDPVPTEENNYLWNGHAFEGKFTDGARNFSFLISEDKPGEWGISYKLLSLVEDEPV